MYCGSSLPLNLIFVFTLLFLFTNYIPGKKEKVAAKQAAAAGFDPMIGAGVGGLILLIVIAVIVVVVVRFACGSAA